MNSKRRARFPPPPPNYFTKSGREGLSIYKNNPRIRLCITDMVMPNGDGFEVIDGMSGSDITIIATSGITSDEMRRRAEAMSREER